jgi:Flp pilus assembly protein TadG
VNQARKFSRCESGASLVEFAVVAPFLILLLIGLIDLGRYTYDGILAANAARAGVQYGAQNLQTAVDATGIENAAVADAQSLPNLSASPSPYCLVGGAVSSCTTAGAVPYIKVVATGTFTPLIKYPGIPSSVQVTGSAVLRIETK